MIIVLMASGIEFSFPCDAYPKLAAATDAARANIELSPMGLHWPDLDEDLSIRGLLEIIPNANNPHRATRYQPQCWGRSS